VGEERGVVDGGRPSPGRSPDRRDRALERGVDQDLALCGSGSGAGREKREVTAARGEGRVRLGFRSRARIYQEQLVMLDQSMDGPDQL
jgi:hypothetical protein